MKLALHENKMVYDIVEHGNTHVPEIESKPVRLCPECFSDELKIVEDKCNKEVYKCQNCNCRFQVTEMSVSTKLFDILSRFISNRSNYFIYNIHNYRYNFHFGWL